MLRASSKKKREHNKKPSTRKTKIFLKSTTTTNMRKVTKILEFNSFIFHRKRLLIAAMFPNDSTTLFFQQWRSKNSEFFRRYDLKREASHFGGHKKKGNENETKEKKKLKKKKEMRNQKKSTRTKPVRFWSAVGGSGSDGVGGVGCITYTDRGESQKKRNKHNDCIRGESDGVHHLVKKWKRKSKNIKEE